MIYNLLKYLQNETPTISFAVNGFHDTTPKNAISINETTSTPAKWIDRNDVTIQFIGRNENIVKAKEQLQSVFDKVDRYFDIVLPENIIDNVTYPEIKAYQMTPLQGVTWFGYDQNGLAEYLFNLQIIIK